eukprot:3657537-Alexandrium_andersonii.AAC.1
MLSPLLLRLIAPMMGCSLLRSSEAASNWMSNMMLARPNLVASGHNCEPSEDSAEVRWRYKLRMSRLALRYWCKQLKQLRRTT